MRLLASTDMALRVVMLLGRQGPGEQMNVETIALQLGNLSRNHLHKIVQDLAALGVLRTIRGAGGGVTLAAPGGDAIGLVDPRSGLDSAARRVFFRADGGCCVLELAASCAPCCATPERLSINVSTNRLSPLHRRSAEEKRRETAARPSPRRARLQEVAVALTVPPLDFTGLARGRRRKGGCRSSLLLHTAGGQYPGFARNDGSLMS